jgi:hypothetical protein
LFLPEGKQEKYTQIFTIKGGSLEQTKIGKEGEIIVLPKVEGLQTGDTFSTKPLSQVLPKPEMPEPMLYLDLIPETKTDEDKISSAIAKVKEEDPSLVFYRHPERSEGSPFLVVPLPRREISRYARNDKDRGGSLTRREGSPDKDGRVSQRRKPRGSLAMFRNSC